MDVTCKCSIPSGPFDTEPCLTSSVQVVPCLNLSVIECSLGLICVSIPPLRPLAARIWPKDMTSRLRGSRPTSAKSPLHSLSFSKRSAKRQSDATTPTLHASQTDLYGTQKEIEGREMDSEPHETKAMRSQRSSYI
jgi:hypothetical protein